MNKQKLFGYLYALFYSVSVLAAVPPPLLSQGEQFDNLDTVLANIMPRKPVLAVAVSPDGKFLASASDNNTIYLWDIASGRELKRLKGDSDKSINAITFSPDGKILAAGASDKSVYLWYIKSGQQIKRLDKHSDDVMAVAFSPDGKTLASSDVEGNVYLWDLVIGQFIQSLTGHSASVNAIAFSPEGKRLATGSSDTGVYLWEVSSAQLIQRIEGHSDSVSAAKFSPNGELLATASWDQTVRLWRMSSGEEVQRLEGHSHNINTLAFSPDGKMLASGAMDTSIRLWDLQLQQQIKSLSGHTNNVAAVAFSPDGKLLASGSWDKTVRLWDVQAGQEVRRFEGQSSAVNLIAISPDGQTLASSSDDQGVSLWQLSSTQPVIKRLANFCPSSSRTEKDASGVSPPRTDAEAATDVSSPRIERNLGACQIKTLAFSPNGNSLAIGTEDKIIYLLDRQSGQQLKPIKHLKGHTEDINHLAFSPDGNILASGSRYPTDPDSPETPLRLWNLQSGQEIKRLKGHTNHVMKVAFSPDGKTLASASDDNTIRLWKIPNASLSQPAGSDLIKQLNGHAHFVTAIAFSPDGHLLASGSWDKTVRLWNVKTGQEIKRLEGHTHHVTTVAFSPDGKTLASGSRDKTVRLWRVSTSEELNQKADLQGMNSANMRILQYAAGLSHAAVVNTVTFSADGNTLASASRDSSIRLWDVKTGELQQMIIKGLQNNYISCLMPTQRCWRVDDGSLVVKKQPDGRIQPLPPINQAEGRIVIEAFPASLALAHGEPLPLTLTIHNTGIAPVYWLNLVQTANENNPLVFYPPKTHLVLEPNKSIRLAAKVSAWAKYENPEQQNTALNLSITSTNADSFSVNMPVQIDIPRLTLQKASLVPEQTALVMTIRNEGNQALSQTEFTARLDNQLLENKVVTRNVIAAGQTLNLSFSLSDDIPIDKMTENTPVSLHAIKLQHPIHQWDLLPKQPLEVPTPSWYSYVLLSVLLIAILISLYYLSLYLHPLVLRISADNAQLLTLPLEQLPKAKQLLQKTRRLDSVLSTNDSHLKWLEEAINFSNTLSNQARCKLLGNRLSAKTQPFKDNSDVFSWQLNQAIFPLKLDRCSVYFPTADLPAAEIIMRLQQEDIHSYVMLVISLEPNQQAALRPYGENRTTRWVVPNSKELTTLLLSPKPIEVFVPMLANQLTLTYISPYQTGGGISKDSGFFGREYILAQILNRDLMNYLVIGARQIGKTSLLRHLKRRYQTHPNVDCVYRSLGDGNSQYFRDKLNEYLADLPTQQQRLLLLDEADVFIRDEIANGYPMLSHFRSLSDEGRCHFILAGFWDLHQAAVLDYFSPVKNFGEPITIGALELKGCRELATKPMTMLGIHYAQDDLVEQIITATGQRPNLVATVCDKLLKNLAGERRELNAEDVTNALQSQTVFKTFEGWESLSNDKQAARLDRLIVYTMLEKKTFKLSDVVRVLDEHDSIYTTEQLIQSLARLELAFIIQHTDEVYRYCVPLFREMLMKKEEREVFLTEELKKRRAHSRFHG